jgi:hypothetical protein
MSAAGSTIVIPCRCENGRPCGKTMEVRTIGKMTMLNIVGHDDSKGMMLIDEDRRKLIEALGGEAR